MSELTFDFCIDGDNAEVGANEK